MTTEIASSAQPIITTSSPLYCALSGKPINPEEAYWAPPLITTRSLVTTVVSTALRSPANLGPILFSEQQDVAYAPDAKPLLAKRRSAEQAKLLLILLVIAAIILTPVVLLAIR